ncbi:thioesterase family protein [Variovorax guangxiensis]|uniref:LysR family transcriptional regulator n=1 Tax=Variovorax guangxiensis TaxID=1775474 RepID=A0A502DTG8_9BURK|nr:LysR family transcriptional regulator [Variovorax guangxiensis]RZI65329.1 MAG: LysR family transcriptional regulator [Variovorax sp.]TPG24458.1 LysR family transcriptional regulator [Variovorax ginsengisoli]TPG28708.1 LysR family transcriptional regulator [Variovorax guangxiensis]
MKNELSAGATTRRDITVDRRRTVDFLGESLRIYATPELVRDVEETCLDFLLGHVDEGENSVGTAIAVKHGGATLLGQSVRIDARVSALDGRSVTFEFSVHEGDKEVAGGTHSRFVVNVDRLRAKVQAGVQQSASAR